MANLVRFSQCKSMVFISYAHADDELNNEWITNFAEELQKDLVAALSREKNMGRSDMPGVYLSKYTGPVDGDLGPQLRGQVEKSFAMIIVVDENYASSDWCLQELRYFNQAFGGDGLDTRLAIVALRKAPIDAVTARPQWHEVFAGRNPVWRDFGDPNALNKRPVPVLRDDGRGLTQAFDERYQPLRDSLLDKIRADLSSPPVSRPTPRWVVGACTPGLLERVQRFADELARHEPQVGLVEPATLQSGKALQALMQGASLLILPFDRGQPIFDAIDGGHIALQLGAWRKLGKSDDAVVLLDLCGIADAEPAEPQHLKFLDDCPLPKLSPEQTLDRLVPRPVAAPANAARTPTLPVRVFIESNRNEPGEWKKLGEQIRTRWNQLLRDNPVDAPLSLRTAGFDIDALADFSFDEADGLVMLWGQKDRRSLVSQITLVDDRLSEPAPAIVAHLSPPQPHSELPLPACKWEVLRFCARGVPPPPALEPEPGDDEQLTSFVQDVLSNTLRRHGVAQPARGR